MVPHRSCFISLLLSFLEGQSGVRFNILMVYTSLYQYFKCNMALWPWNFVLIYLKRNLVLESQGPLNWLMQKFSNISGYWRIFNNFRFYRDFTLWSEWLFFHYVHLLFPFFKRLFFPFSLSTYFLFLFGLLFPFSFLDFYFPLFFFSLFFFGHFSSLFFLDFYSIAVTFWISSNFLFFGGYLILFLMLGLVVYKYLEIYA